MKKRYLLFLGLVLIGAAFLAIKFLRPASHAPVSAKQNQTAPTKALPVVATTEEAKAPVQTATPPVTPAPESKAAPEQPASVVVNAALAQTPPTVVTSAAAASPNAVTPPVAPAIPETVGTRRMYAAHASLRTPTIADPDSGQNRQILQSMVTKALARTDEPRQNAAPTSK
ncbi:MAG: hypothetical protein QM715_20165 [Nibricoccus sp.]